jgi:DnaK suppressor protein
MMPTLDELRQRLVAERNRLQSEIEAVSARPAEFRPTHDSYYGNHLADVGSDTFEEEKAVAIEAHLTGMLQKVTDALERFENGTYGICQECRQPIPPERLEALPYATNCVSCSAPKKARAAGRVQMR